LHNIQIFQVSPVDPKGLFEPFQSAFRPPHSTETALLQMVHGFRINKPVQHFTQSAIKYPSLTFSDIGITGSGLSWIISYITETLGIL